MLPSVSKTTVLGGIFTLVTKCLHSAASAVPYARYLEKRADPVCTLIDLVIIDKILTGYSSAGSQICTELLHLTQPGTVTTTATTIVTIPTLLTGNTVVTVTQGTSTARFDTTTTSTSTDTTTTTIPSTVTTTVEATATTQPVTLTRTVINPTTTTPV